MQDGIFQIMTDPWNKIGADESSISVGCFTSDCATPKTCFHGVVEKTGVPDDGKGADIRGGVTIGWYLDHDDDWTEGVDVSDQRNIQLEVSSLTPSDGVLRVGLWTGRIPSYYCSGIDLINGKGYVQLTDLKALCMEDGDPFQLSIKPTSVFISVAPSAMSEIKFEFCIKGLAIR